METKFKIDKCTLVPRDGTGLKENLDIVRGNPIIDYYESVKSPSISMTLTFIDIDQVITREGVYGGESIDLSITVEGFDDFKISSKPRKQNLVLNAVRDVTTTTNKQIATLEFVSMESLINETARVNKKFTGNISQTVEQLLKKDKKGIKTKKKISKDRSTNSYSFIGNLKRPFDTIQWLCPRSQSSKKNFGFLFFETLDGYNFKSIEELLKKDPVRYEQPDRPIEGSFKILKNKLNQSNDIGMNLRMGMYANKTIYVDIENQVTDVVDFKVTELDLKKPVKLMDKLEDSPSRLMLRVNDFGVAQKGSKKTDVQKLSELAVYQNKSYIRNNLLFSQSLNISIPFNPDLRAGDMIDIKLPVKESNKPKQGGDSRSSSDVAPVARYGSEKDNDLSGKYMISELRHLIGGQKSETQLMLIRDVFSA